jgi:hypothetical protein
VGFVPKATFKSKPKPNQAHNKIKTQDIDKKQYSLSEYYWKMASPAGHEVTAEDPTGQ